ncbi:DUF2759 family protein [Brevibacillus marinus]|uniref:DUF2759 family protein n=1 Tax=Brevibacillus marinus TaxID=2496837 RepID=UPI000F83B03E|nr:DUF2759 family protein [Brevibacillus marinus]
MNLFDVLMFFFTILIALGVYRSFKAKNTFAVVYGAISLAVFLFSDALIIYYAFIKPVG